jgi:hypothetical protein
VGLHPLRELNSSEKVKPHVIGVESKTDLHDLWARARPFIDPRKTTRIFWAACSSIKVGGNPCVDLQAD